MKKILCLFALYLLVVNCAAQNKIATAAKKYILNDSIFAPAHVGISIYNPSTNQYLYNYQGNKYFVPASNTKLFTCYAAMKHLGDSLVGLRYQEISDTAINIFATGDPTFLHQDFKTNNTLDFLKGQRKKLYISANWHSEVLGRGWAWDDYASSYMVERSPLPIYGNVFMASLLDSPIIQKNSIDLKWKTNSAFFNNLLPTFFSLQLKDIISREFIKDTIVKRTKLFQFELTRARASNYFNLLPTKSLFKKAEIPYNTDTLSTAIEILRNDFQLNNLTYGYVGDNTIYNSIPERLAIKTIHSQPTDSLLKPMMHRSDNFFAEQSLLMVSNEMLGVMNDEKIIDSLLKTDFKDLPQKPKWVDGSGLSRYNLITPQDFVSVLAKMKKEFSWARITTILPTGGKGTLESYYKNYVGKIYAKTGTLSNHVSLSGYIITQKNKTLIFSVLVNAHQTSASNIRKAVENFIADVIENN